MRFVTNDNVNFFKIPPVLIGESYPGFQAFMIRLRAKNCGRVKMERHQKLRGRNENILVPSSVLFRQGIEEWHRIRVRARLSLAPDAQGCVSRVCSFPAPLSFVRITRSLETFPRPERSRELSLGMFEENQHTTQ